MVWKTAITALAFLTATAATAAPDLTAAEKEAISKAFSGILLDDTTARWRWLPPAEGNVITYCGFVNAKNSYGAYTGFRPFMVALVRRTAMASLPTIGAPGSDDEVITIRMCSTRGYDLTEVPAE